VSSVKLILRESVHNLGEAGDVVSVKPGYARNYLLPQGKAIPATESRVAELEHHKRILAEKVAKELKDLRSRKQALEGLSLQISARAGEGGRLFGSVTAAQIADALAQAGHEIDRRRIDVREAIKEIGKHSVPVKLHREVVAKITVDVVAAEAAPEEAEEQLEGGPEEPRERRRGRRRDRDEEESEAPEASEERADSDED
jgi:large subunit ribosomal protein L9